MTKKIYVSYSHPKDVYALHMIRGKFLFTQVKDADVVLYNHQLNGCHKSLILLSEEADMVPLIEDFKILKMENIPVYITKIHNHETPAVPEAFTDIPIHEWSLDNIVAFCS